MSQVSKVKITFDTSNIDSIWWYGWKAPSLNFPKLFADWKSIVYSESYEQRCVRPFWTSFDTFDIHSITALIVYIELLSTPLTWVTLLCIESSLCTFDTSDMSKITVYILLCKSTTFDTPDIHSLWSIVHSTAQSFTPLTPPTCPFIFY